MKRYYITIASEYLYNKYKETMRYIVEANDITNAQIRANDYINVLKKANTLQDFFVVNICEI